MTYQKLILFLMLVVCQKNHGQDSILKAKTFFIGNSDFVIYQPYMNLEIDSVGGEDLKSKDYSTYYNYLSKKYPQWKNKTTIASNEIMIDLGVLNYTSSSWKVDKLTLTITDSVSLRDNEVKVNKWPYKHRGEEDVIRFTIQNINKSLVFVPNSIIVKPNGESDNLFNITVGASEDFKKERMLLKFKFKLNLVEVGSDKSEVFLSDKEYLIFFNK